MARGKKTNIHRPGKEKCSIEYCTATTQDVENENFEGCRVVGLAMRESEQSGAKKRSGVKDLVGGGRFYLESRWKGLTEHLKDVGHQRHTLCEPVADEQIDKLTKEKLRRKEIIPD